MDWVCMSTYAKLRIDSTRSRYCGFHPRSWIPASLSKSVIRINPKIKGYRLNSLVTQLLAGKQYIQEKWKTSVTIIN